MKIENVKSEYVVKGDHAYKTKDIQEEWKSYNAEEKAGWFVGKENRFKASAKDVLYNLFNDFEESGGYEDMAEKCFDSVPDSQIDELQRILDNICEDESFCVIFAGEEIEAK